MFKVRFVRDFVRKWVESGRVAAINISFKSNHCEKILGTTEKKFFKVDNKISITVDEYLTYSNFKRDEFKSDLGKGGKSYPKIDRKELDSFLE